MRKLQFAGTVMLSEEDVGDAVLAARRRGGRGTSACLWRVRALTGGRPCPSWCNYTVPRAEMLRISVRSGHEPSPTNLTCGYATKAVINLEHNCSSGGRKNVRRGNQPLRPRAQPPKSPGYQPSIAPGCPNAQAEKPHVGAPGHRFIGQARKPARLFKRPLAHTTIPTTLRQHGIPTRDTHGRPW